MMRSSISMKNNQSSKCEFHSLLNEIFNDPEKQPVQRASILPDSDRTIRSKCPPIIKEVRIPSFTTHQHSELPCITKNAYIPLQQREKSDTELKQSIEDLKSLISRYISNRSPDTAFKIGVLWRERSKLSEAFASKKYTHLIKDKER